MDAFANSEYPDEIQHKAAFHHGLHVLLRSKSSGTHPTLETLTFDPLKHIIDNPVDIAHIVRENPWELYKQG